MPNHRTKIAYPAWIAAAVLLAACGGPNVAAAWTPGNTLQQDQSTEVPRASLQEAKAALDAGSAIFLDVRGQAPYESQHIQGALNIPLHDLEARLGELDKAEWIITYCT